MPTSGWPAQYIQQQKKTILRMKRMNESIEAQPMKAERHQTITKISIQYGYHSEK
uniref:Uncharacterized protein n=1 Tax=Rhizophora mucronata TaxID=61149 RepID=A0A2P2N5Z8_RHIMU